MFTHEWFLGKVAHCFQWLSYLLHSWKVLLPESRVKVLWEGTYAWLRGHWSLLSQAPASKSCTLRSPLLTLYKWTLVFKLILQSRYFFTIIIQMKKLKIFMIIYLVKCYSQVSSPSVSGSSLCIPTTICCLLHVWSWPGSGSIKQTSLLAKTLLPVCGYYLQSTNKLSSCLWSCIHMTLLVAIIITLVMLHPGNVTYSFI